MKDLLSVADANEVKDSVNQQMMSHVRPQLCKVQDTGKRGEEKHQEDTPLKSNPAELRQVHLPLIWTGSQRGLLGLPSFSENGLCESEGTEGANVRTRAPTVRKPSQDLHNKSMEPSRGTLVLIKNIKVSGHRTASGGSHAADV